MVHEIKTGQIFPPRVLGFFFLLVLGKPSIASQEAEPGVSLNVLQDEHPPAHLPVAASFPGLLVPKIISLGMERLEFALLLLSIQQNPRPPGRVAVARAAQHPRARWSFTGVSGMLSHPRLLRGAQMLANKDLPVAKLHGTDWCGSEWRALQARVQDLRGEERGFCLRTPGHAARSMVEVANAGCSVTFLGLKNQCYPGAEQHEKAGKDA